KVDVYRARNRGEQRGQHRLDLIHHLDGVGADFTLDQQQLGSLAVEPCASARIDRGVDDVANVFDGDRRAILVGQNDVAELVGAEQLVVGVERELLMRAFKIALRRIKRCGAERTL